MHHERNDSLSSLLRPVVATLVQHLSQGLNSRDAKDWVWLYLLVASQFHNQGHLVHFFYLYIDL